VAAAAERAAGHPVSSGVSGLNGATGGAKVNAAPGDAASNRALEAVVLELLKPMLRQWLDENMPRLVAQAISDEAVRARLPDGAKKP
jgi:cell pole-organizing protein PopZ